MIYKQKENFILKQNLSILLQLFKKLYSKVYISMIIKMYIKMDILQRLMIYCGPNQ